MELTWASVYDNAVERFAGQTPSRQVEADIIEAFERQPAAVRAAIDKLGERFAKAKVHTPWPLVLRELQAGEDRSSIVASDESERERAVARAERYIVNAGIFLPDEVELVDALFGPHGPLKLWAGDEALERRLVDLWRAERPRGERVEAEAIERGWRWQEVHEQKPVEPLSVEERDG